MSTNRISKICVFCGHRPGAEPFYEAKTAELGAEMLRRGLSLTYGGGTVGLMGTVGRVVNEGGGHVLGVIPAPIAGREVLGEPIGETVVVNDMHSRKLTMYRRCDAFIALPGGFGTLDELFEVLAWHQLGIHNKPIGLLNVNGYFDPLVKLVQNGFRAGFISDDMANRAFVVASEPAELLDKLLAHQPPPSAIKWLEEDQL
eukprot:TRINITY_DN125_c0_g1_i3.p2 TRINITY_DN125_c0_g1~~TRINITY_DN125_c0_g1_i3.p2  ORF type:complete len:201 (-),score=55.67 TRINITY_DN125_c0_g1_i3:121-723(-)